jgi:hypothetical protein
MLSSYKCDTTILIVDFYHDIIYHIVGETWDYIVGETRDYIVGETRDHIVGETRDHIVGETREVHFVQNTSDITCLSWICQSDLSDVNIMSW